MLLRGIVIVPLARVADWLRGYSEIQLTRAQFCAVLYFKLC
jgi:hypothetical protein